MAVEDHHRIRLDQSVWDPTEQHLLPRTRAQIGDTVRQRFPEATDVLLAGELITNYYDEQSDLDVVVVVPPEKLTDYKEELQFINGRNLLPTEHELYWYLIPDTVERPVLVERFGLLYDVIRDLWYGRRISGLTQLARPEAIVQYVNWQLFKYKQTLELFPLTWTYVFAAFSELKPADKSQVIDDLKRRGHRIGRLIRKALKSGRNGQLWKQVEVLEDQLLETEDEDLPLALAATKQIPLSLLWLVLHRFRYKNLADRLETMAVESAEAAALEESLRDLPIDI